MQLTKQWTRNIAAWLIVVTAMWATSAVAQNRPLRLVCFELAGMERALDGVTSEQQLTRAAPVLRSGSCDWVDIPSGSTARYLGIHRGPHDLLFPLYRVTYATTGQRMVAVDGAFRADAWRMRRDHLGVDLLTPRSCDALDGLLRFDREPPRYVIVPPICREQVVR
jgi:hypothetical protein